LEPDEPQIAPPLFAVIYLPCGMLAGYRAIALAYVLATHGVSVAAIAGVAALALLPTTWQFLIGPLIDVSFSSRTWYVVSAAASALCLGAWAVVPLSPKALPLIAALAFAGGVAATFVWAAAGALMAHTTPARARGAAAGWAQVANMAGAGLVGGAGLWVVAHAGGVRVASLALALACLACMAPVLRTRPIQAAGGRLIAKSRVIGAELWGFARARRGALTLFLMLLPLDLGAAMGLLPTVAGRWRASADLVALASGAVGGLAFAPGCVVGGYLTVRFPHRPLYVGLSLAFAAGEAAMALAPHTPYAFVAFILLNNLLLGAANGAYTAVIFDCLGPRSAATLGSILFSLGQIPLLLMTTLVGWASARGADAMLYAEAGAAVLATILYAAAATAWRPTRIQAPAAAPAPALT
jgi:MFS transporter, PAT family, beta-lactamase induction signal transducer AmpG